MRAGNAIRKTSVVLLAAALAAVSGIASADFKRDYAKGLDAAKDGNWTELQTLMQSAVKEEGAPQARMKLYGMRFEPYVPKYYLGLAAYRTGNCAGAVSNWEDASTRSIVGGIPALKSVADAGLSDCKTKLAGTTSPTTPAVATTTTTAPTTTTPAPPKPTVPGPTTPTTAPTTAPTPTTVATAPKPPTPTPTPPKPTPTPTPTAPVAAAPAALVTAIDNFIAGRYAQAAGVDPGAFGGDNKARYHALLVRAAARHTQMLAGELPESTLAQVQTDVRTAKGLFPSSAPDTALFSPRFRQLYTSTR